MRLTVQELEEREAAALAMYRRCRLCARDCDVDRTAGGRGPCLLDDRVHLGGWGIHFGEEPELTGPKGCGLVLLAGCNLSCHGCETSSFSRELVGVRTVTTAELAGIVLELEARGAQAVQFVTPTHQMPVIVAALRRAATRGFHTPVVWNCGGYESLEALAVLDGVVDVYLPDLKHGDDGEGKLAGVMDYFAVAKACLTEMYRQVGLLELDGHGLARRGLYVRHLVLPDDAAASEAAMRFLASLSPALRVNVMPQFQPVYQLAGHARLGRRVRPPEVERVLALARAAGLENVWSSFRSG